MLTQKEFIKLQDGVTQRLLALSKDISENGATEEHRQAVGEFINRSKSLHEDWLKLSSDEDVHSESSQGLKLPVGIRWNPECDAKTWRRVESLDGSAP